MKKDYIFSLIKIGIFSGLVAICTKIVDDKDFNQKVKECLREEGLIKDEEEAE